jgi:hypothetical protein
MTRRMRIALHDFAGHPFQFQLSRALAARGHTVNHFYFAGDPGPKGRTGREESDPDTFAVTPLEIGRPYLKSDFVGRWRNDSALMSAVNTQDAVRRSASSAARMMIAHGRRRGL